MLAAWLIHSSWACQLFVDRGGFATLGSAGRGRAPLAAGALGFGAGGFVAGRTAMLEALAAVMAGLAGLAAAAGLRAAGLRAAGLAAAAGFAAGFRAVFFLAAGRDRLALAVAGRVAAPALAVLADAGLPDAACAAPDFSIAIIWLRK